MTATYTKTFLTASTNGRGIKVSGSASPGTTIHTAVSGSTGYDEIWLYANNTDTSQIKLNIEFGGTTSPDDEIQVYIQSLSGLILVVPGLVLNGACVVRAYASNPNVIDIYGWVNRIT